MKKLDGTWVYDYTVFDKWVEFMMNEVGIKDLISCYTMIPWALSFDYLIRLPTACSLLRLLQVRKPTLNTGVRS